MATANYFPRQTVTFILDTLEKNGLAVRKPHPNDRRRKRVQLTPKGKQLAGSPWAAVTFFWPELERQVRVEGRVTQLPAAVSDAYFSSRPRGSRIGAWASAQSQPLEDGISLTARVEALNARYPDEVPRPPHWGGYGLNPDRVEFWQGRPSRLHDRVLYLPEGTGWQRSRLQP